MEGKVCRKCVAGVSNSLPPWNTMEYNGIQWNTMEYRGIPWNSMEYNGIQCNSMEYYGIPWNTMEYAVFRGVFSMEYN